MTRPSFRAVAGLVLMASVAAANGNDKKPEPLAIKLSSNMTPSDSDVVVRMRVEPDARSRELIIEWESDDLSGGSHAITLEGQYAATTHSFRIRRIPEGQYVVRAILRLSDGSEVRKASKLTVIGMFPPSISYGSGSQGSAGGLRRATRP